MISASTEFIQALQDNHTFKVKIEATLTDGTQLTIENPNIKMDSMSFEKAVSGDSTFDIGSFIVGKLSLTLNNIPGTYNGLDFDGAVFALYFANALSNALYPSDELYPGTDLYPVEIISQYVLIGTYTVVDTDGQNGAWIAITAYDNACRFQAPLSDVSITFPTTAYSLVSAICSHVGVTATTIPNTLANITISALGEDVEPNCLQAIAWCAMLIGTNATINPSGQLTFMWYDTTTLSSVRADIETNGWDNADLSAVHESTGLIDVRTMVDDVTITGVAVTYNDADGNAVTTPISGSTGYVINVAENAFVTADNVTAVLANLASALVGMTFRPFEVTMMSNPLFEPGDIVWFHNRKGQKFLSVITSLSSPVGNHMTLLCGAETPKRQSAMDYSATTRVIQQTKAVAVKALNAANSAADVANATRQYFWHDTNGVHVADEANNATANRNTLWNSLGMLFRKGANVLLGILTGDSPKVVIYDGLGNTDDHIAASFSANGVVVGLADSIHSTMEADGFGVAYDTDRLFDVSTNGYFTNIYIGGSSKATGMLYTDMEVLQTVSFLETCTISGTSVIGPNGVPTGYTLQYYAGADIYYVLDVNGNQFESAAYAGIYYAPRLGIYEPDIKLDGSTEVNTAQAIINMGGVGIMAFDHVLEVDADTINVSKKRTDGVVDGDIVISKDQIAFGNYQSGALWYRSSLSMAADGQRGTFVFNSGAPYGGQLAIENYDNNNGTLYTGMENIDGIGDGTVTGAISNLANRVSVFAQAGNDVTLTNNSPTTVANITLKKGIYLLTGAARFSASTAGRRTLVFSRYGNNGNPFDNFGIEQINPSQSGVAYATLTWFAEIDTDGTTVYFNLSQNSGGDLNVDKTGIKVVALDGGGIYAVG